MQVGARGCLVAAGILMRTRTQRRGGRGRRRFGHSPLHLLLRPHRDSASDVAAYCGTSPSLQSHSPFPRAPHPFFPFPPSPKRKWPSKQTDRIATIGASLGAYRGLGWRVLERKQGVRNLGPMSPPVALIGNDLLVRGVDACRCAYARGGCDLVATLGVDRWRCALACKIRLQLTEGSRVHRLLMYRS